MDATYNAAMFGKTVKTSEITPEDVVSLKPLFGIKPGHYLAVLYALILLAVFFAVLVLPGILNPGSLVNFDSEPRGAAVRVDGVYAGSVPCSIFIPEGKRSIEFVSPGFPDVVVEKQVRGRVFASLFFPLRDSVYATLVTNDPVQALILGATDYARWSFTGEPTATYQIPRVLSEAAYRTAPAAIDANVRTQMNELLQASARFAETPFAMRELLRASILVDGAGLSPSPIVAIRSARGILEYLSNASGSSAWLAAALGEEASSLVAGSTWYTSENNKASELVAASRGRHPANGKLLSRKVGVIVFREIPGGLLTPTSTFPRNISIDTFWIAENEVDDEAWADFVSASPEWSAEKKDDLASRGLVSDDYLVKSSDSSYPAPSLSGVSWNAAAAFCAWLTQKLPKELSSYEIRLPTEAEWEFAAKYGGSDLKRMSGSLWEWCENNYAPMDFLPADEISAQRIGAPEKSVRGGSWVNPTNSVSIGTRASLPPSFCSSFVGFRPIIAQKQRSPEVEARLR